ncbi:flagellar biosynthesis protein FlgK [Brevundimonas sp. Leaf363]|uniref:flagellar hook-associated protein FlgK n=1 Tax=Brevundimonas sp. Leaf363 TaxID=1736353 RepID=UPI0006F4A88B|nr:flagellar hook-associated protein FlgK [Brevundimonas sp. Leaf363]KQS55769.1 flagellar biosynthesis protein FlgK [Brevundimonas sp. Leaf363]
MSLNSILNIANSGLAAAQTQLRVVSDNVSNVNTPGYVRKIADQVSVTSQGAGAGVEVARIRLATDRFLQAASLNAGSEASRQGVRYELYDRIQSLFGDPSGDDSFFASVDGVFAAFASAAEDPTSSPYRQEALYKTQALFDEAGRIQTQIQAVREDADGRIQSAVDSANSLLEQIEGLNKEIARGVAVGGDSSGAETAQATLIGQLAELMDIQIQPRTAGGVSIRTTGGALLAGNGYAKLDYARAGTVNAESAFSDIYITEPGGQKRALMDTISSGEIKGLVELRDTEAPAASQRLGELMARVADQLNRAHNANSSVPAPSTLTGRNVGQSLETAIAGFTGGTTVAVTSSAGVIQTSAHIDFSAGTINGTAFTANTFLSVLNTQLGGQATASFDGGVLSFSATAPNGVAIADDAANPSGMPATAPSLKTGRGFSHFFGLNDLVSTDRTAIYETGLTPGASLGFAAGQSLTFRFTDNTGSRLRDVTVAVPSGGTVQNMLDALNSTSGGVGAYGSFALDANGALSFTASGSPAPTMSVLEDTTSQNPSGVSLTELFGIGGGVRASRADGFSIRTDIRQTPTNLALAKLNLSAAAGASALSTGDGRGAQGLANAGQLSSRFAAAGGAMGGSMSVSRYASELAGDIGAKATVASNRNDTAQALYSEASARQTSYEGVNLDEELVLMTTYQQAFNASARLIQAAKDMYDTLLGMI